MVVLAAGGADEWQDISSRCLIPISCGAFESGFRGEMGHLRVDEKVSISSIATGGLAVDRSHRLAARAEVDDVHLSLQLSSRGTVRQGARMIALRPGGAAIYATDSPYFLDYTEPGQRQLIVQMSRSALDVPPDVLAGVMERLALGQSAATRVFFSHAMGLHRSDEADTVLDGAASEVTRDLASAMIRSTASGRPSLPRTPDGLLRAIEDFVEVNLSTVRVEDIVDEFFISRRTVYHLFERLETTPSDYLRRRRLAVAASALKERGRAEEPIAAIAAGAGFADATTFTRAFRREHGMTPSEWRARTSVGESAPVRRITPPGGRPRAEKRTPLWTWAEPSLHAA